MVVQSNGAIRHKSIEVVRAFDVIHLSFEPHGSIIRQSSVENILATAKAFKEVGIYVYLFATIHALNVDKIDWMVSTANNNGIDIGFNICMPTESNLHLLLSSQTKEMVTRKLDRLFREGRILRFTSPLVAILDNRKRQKYADVKGGCTAGIAACVVLPNGDVAPCPFLRVKAGNIYEKQIEDIWLNAEIFNVLRNRQRFDEPCGSCEHLAYCGGCRKRALEHTGRLTGADPDCFKKPSKGIL